MKRVGNLLVEIAARDNLALAFHKASRGKRYRPEVQRFAEDLEDRLQSLRLGLLRGDVSLGRSHTFMIRDPKPREICAPCFEERVLHHAIMNVCEPVFERTAIDHSYACRRGKGRLAALETASKRARSRPFFLKMDMRAYFHSINHSCLLELLQRRFKDPGLLKLFARLVRSFEKGPGRGLPIGNLTSQHFANFYLSPFDRFVQERLKVPYVRYMDDVVLWGEDSHSLREYRDLAREFLDERCRLELKPEPYINRTRHGMDFLGYRVFPYRLGLSRRSRVRFRKCVIRYEQKYMDGVWDEAELQRRMTALFAFIIPADSDGAFRRQVLCF